MKKISTLFFLSSLLVGAACTHFEEPPQIKDADVISARTRSGEGPTTFDTLPNPYALDVMQEVYDTYERENRILEPTHLYVRFLPQDSLQMDVLLHDYNLDLFDYPLDLA